MKKIIVVALATLSGVCFGLALSTYLLVSGSFSKTYHAYIVQSGSMAPVLKAGSIVFTQSRNNYNTGDIITFKDAGGSLVTHRIVSITNENGNTAYQTKGDANEDPDGGFVKDEDIIGASIFSIPYIGYLADFVRTPKGFVILVVIPVSIIIYEELKSILKILKHALSRTTLFSRKKINNSPDKKNGLGTTKISILIPLVGVIFLLFDATGSYLKDEETSITNTLGAADNYSFQDNLAPLSYSANVKHPVINEFKPRPSAETVWVEIYNPNETEINLENWKLSDLTGNALSLSGILPGLGFAVFDWNNKLNDIDTIFLINPESLTSDQHEYNSSPGIDKTIGRETDGAGVFKNCIIETKGESNNTKC